MGSCTFTELPWQYSTITNAVPRTETVCLCQEMNENVRHFLWGKKYSAKKRMKLTNGFLVTLVLAYMGKILNSPVYILVLKNNIMIYRCSIWLHCYSLLVSNANFIHMAISNCMRHWRFIPVIGLLARILIDYVVNRPERIADIRFSDDTSRHLIALSHNLKCESLCQRGVLSISNHIPQ